MIGIAAIQAMNDQETLRYWHELPQEVLEDCMKRLLFFLGGLDWINENAWILTDPDESEGHCYAAKIAAGYRPSRSFNYKGKTVFVNEKILREHFGVK